MIDLRFRQDASGLLGRLFPLLSPRQRREFLVDVGTGVSEKARTAAHAKHAGARHPSASGGLWAAIAASVSRQVSGESVTVGAGHSVAAHKQFGGRISAPGRGPGATGAKLLTIPLTPQARGHSVRQLATRYRIFKLGKPGPAHDGDVLATIVNAPSASGGAWKREARRTGFLRANGKTAAGRQRYGTLVPLFVLKRSVKQKAEPWFPDAADVSRTVDAVLFRRLGG